METSQKDDEKLPEDETLPEMMRELTVEKTNKSSNKIPRLAVLSSDSTTDDDSVWWILIGIQGVLKIIVHFDKTGNIDLLEQLGNIDFQNFLRF